MKKQTHFHIARLSVENSGKSKAFTGSGQISKWAFYFGTILPDLSFTQFTHPHYYDKSSDYVFDKLYQIENKTAKGIADAVRLGKIVHYLCDFCCFAHHGGSIGKISEHFLYERRMEKYVSDNYRSLQQRTALCIPVKESTAEPIEQIKTELADYKNMEPGFERDIMKSIQITAIIYFGILCNQLI